MTCCPQLLHAFVYKVPIWGVNLLTPLGLMDVARFVCSRDLIIAEVTLFQSVIFQNRIRVAHALWLSC